MNLFIETLNNFAASLLPIAWQMFWQSGLLIIVIFAVDFLLRRKARASVRYALWLVVLVKLLLPPTLALPTGIAWWLRPGERLPAAVQAKEVVITYPDNVIPFHRPIISATFVPPAPRLSVQAWIFVFASAISAALLAWLLTRWIQISRTVRQATEPGDSIPTVLEDARRTISINSHVCVRITNEKMSPAVCGLFRPMILLPESLAKNLSANQLRAVLVHELVHIKRRDVWVNCLQALLLIIYWWHPLVWFANARIRRAREEAVDDAVMLALRDEADCYAPTLLEVAKHAFHRPLASLGLVGILESRGALRQRIERLIDFKTPRRAGLSIVSTLAIVAFTAAAVPMGEAPPRSSSETKATQGTHSGSDTNSSLPRIMTDPQFKTVLTELQQREQFSQLIQDARLHFELGKYDEAERRLNEVLQADPKSAAANYYLTLVRRSQDQKKISRSGNLVNDLVYRTTNQQAHAAKSIQVAQNNNVPAPELLHATAPISPLDGVLAFDNQLKEATVNAGEAEAKFKFNLTNVASFDVTITNIFTSCGCTVAKMPSSPWLLAPGATGEIPVTMNVAGKSGELTKTITVNSDRGTKILMVRATISGSEPNLFMRTDLIRTSAGRQAIMRKLDSIHLNSVSFDRTPLSEVIRKLSEDVQQNDPEFHGINFLINPNQSAAPAVAIDPATGQPIPPPSASAEPDINTATITINPPLTNVRLANALEAIAKSADKPIKYSILDYAVVFSPLTESDRANQRLHVRGFKVDPNTFIEAIERATGIDFSKSLQTASTAAPQVFASGNSFVTTTNPMTEIQSAFITFFRSAGVDLSPPKSIFYGDRDGSLWVRATAQDLDIIEQVVQTQNTPTPQITIRVKFIELDENIANALSLLWNQTNHSQTAAAPSVILTEPAMKDLMKALQNRAGVTELGDANVTTLSGRQAQIQIVQITNVVSGITNGTYQTIKTMLGPVLDVVPYVSADGYTIQMTISPSFTEFLGYDDPQKVLPNGMKSPLPHFRVRQITTSAIVWDGQTVVLSRLPQKDVVTSNGTTSTNATAEDTKRNLFVLITPTIIDPAGNRIHSDEQIDSLPATRR